MEAESQQPKEREGTVSALNAAIEAMNFAKELKYHASQGCFWLRQRHPRNDQSKFSGFFVDRLETEMRLGCDDQQDGLRRTWAGLR